MGWSQKFLNKALDRKSWTITAASSPRSDAVDLATGGGIMRCSTGNFLLSYSRAGYQARDPFGDTTLLEVDGKHAFTVVMSADFSARGASYLSRNLFREVQSQVQAAKGDLALAFLTAISALDKAFKRIHPFNGPVLDGVRIAAAYVDVASHTLHLASNGGGSRVVVGSSQPDGGVAVLASVGSEERANSDPAACRVHQLLLSPAVDTIIVGSPGLWREVSADRAVLRMEQFHRSVPAASGGNAAAHLNNLALHAVTERVRSCPDPRMRALRSVQHLQSLWVGDRSNVKLGGRQPVRRKRGDVHGDISASVMHLQWEGSEKGAFREAACRLKHSASLPALACADAQPPSARARWAHVRMHLLEHPRAVRQHNTQKWQQLAKEAVQHARHQKSSQPGKQQREGILIRASSRDVEPTSLISVSA